MSGLKPITRKCFCCEKGVSSADSGKMRHAFGDPPLDATCWTTCGNYGSEIADSLGETKLQITICDDCLNSKRHLVLRFIERPVVSAVSKF